MRGHRPRSQKKNSCDSLSMSIAGAIGLTKFSGTSFTTTRRAPRRGHTSLTAHVTYPSPAPVPLTKHGTNIQLRRRAAPTACGMPTACASGRLSPCTCTERARGSPLNACESCPDFPGLGRFQTLCLHPLHAKYMGILGTRASLLHTKYMGVPHPSPYKIPRCRSRSGFSPGSLPMKQ